MPIMFLRHSCAIAFVLALPAFTAAAQQRPGSAHEDPAASSVVGTYSYVLVPSNKEPITGQLVISQKGERYVGVFTSPKLDGPLDADTLRVSGGHVFVSVFDGMYTFDFDVKGDAAILGATFTKTMGGQTERGQLSIKRVPQ